eukprot:CAMPEP_0118902194 /NCGR_PEP_ID=MMETSP1166-20130328/7590_1 /TAXON_ID=1104430 /ORGANISM="Chrysoreinhardia sp, Strain CCMP3193" /LENGTH=93 /DNA_ID=CAMNT_0006841397 /DNA_START=99 /DNA_END=378 /DNA_ORIENTATION=+
MTLSPLGGGEAVVFEFAARELEAAEDGVDADADDVDGFADAEFLAFVGVSLELGDVEEALAVAEELDEGAELADVGDDALELVTDLDVGDDFG